MANLADRLNAISLSEMFPSLNTPKGLDLNSLNKITEEGALRADRFPMTIYTTEWEQYFQVPTKSLSQTFDIESYTEQLSQVRDELNTELRSLQNKLSAKLENIKLEDYYTQDKSALERAYDYVSSLLTTPTAISEPSIDEEELISRTRIGEYQDEITQLQANLTRGQLATFSKYSQREAYTMNARYLEFWFNPKQVTFRIAYRGTEEKTAGGGFVSVWKPTMERGYLDLIEIELSCDTGNTLPIIRDMLGNAYTAGGLYDLYKILGFLNMPRILANGDPNWLKFVYSTNAFPNITFTGYIKPEGITFNESADDPNHIDYTFSFVAIESSPHFTFDELINMYRDYQKVNT